MTKTVEKQSAITYDIEKNVEVPSYVTCRGMFWMELAERMQHGDSVRVKNKSERNSLSSAIKRNGAMFISRFQKDESFRVWKIVSGLSTKKK